MVLRACLLRACNGGVVAGIAVGILVSAGVSPAPAQPAAEVRLLNPAIYRPAEITPEVARVKAVGDILSDNYDSARVYAGIANDSAITALLDWRETMFAGDESAFDRISAFVAKHPDWPASERMRAQAERSLRKWPRPAEMVLAYFELEPPITVSGKLALAAALRQAGRMGEATDLVRTLWQEEELSASLEDEVLKDYGAVLTADEHKARLAQRIYDRDLPGALRAAKRLDGNAETFAKAAISLAKGHREGFKLYEKLPESAKNQLPMRYALTRYYRLTDKEALARKVALSAKPGTGKDDNPGAWWEEKRILVRDALGERREELYRQAYELASSHGNDAGLPFVEGEFLSGWIALRFLKEPERALPHFKALAAGNPRPVNISQGEYWAGRSYDALGQPAEALKHYRRAGAHPTTFYGQLARDRLGWPRVPDSIVNGGHPRLDALVSLENSDLFRATRLIAAAGRSDVLPMFLQAVMRQTTTNEQKAAFVHWVSRMGWPHYALRLAKAVSIEGVDLGQQAFPAPVFHHEPLTEQPEIALIYGVIRQESEFNPKAESHAGARGLMQIMPKTARGLSRNYQTVYDLTRLVSDPDYNVQLGSALLHELLNTFDGVYALAIAAYNAGPAPVYRWMEQHGDPRKGEVDLLDWIEMIPYTETRNYVKRVMENMNVYRAHFRKEEPDTLFVGLQRSLKGDLQRQAGCEVVSHAGTGESVCR
ncbi:transglycosylase SLT domain-containing protein [Rhodoligotrophos defluvii]|uniref:lytic transglycosylase domain-containing protein n=1 Tax=Rhodoligotrophos defluvii TaxID=2561934 RepID=UPI0010C950EE|nr:transglycosylase SLT domain-containing protein [Rhodoligotrophos defluvii]